MLVETLLLRRIVSLTFYEWVNPLCTFLCRYWGTRLKKFPTSETLRTQFQTWVFISQYKNNATHFIIFWLKWSSKARAMNAMKQNIKCKICWILCTLLALLNISLPPSCFPLLLFRTWKVNVRPLYCIKTKTKQLRVSVTDIVPALSKNSGPTLSFLTNRTARFHCEIYCCILMLIRSAFYYSQFWNDNGQNVKCARSFIPHSYSGMKRTPFHSFCSKGQNEQNVANAFCE